MKSSEHYGPRIAQASLDLESCELYFLERRAASRALREDPGARAYARQVADALAALVEQCAHPDGQLTLADALDETLAEDIIGLALRHRHALLLQPVSYEGFFLLKQKLSEACGVLEHFGSTGSVR